MISSLKFIKFLHLPFVHLPVRSYAAIDAQCIIKVFTYSQLSYYCKYEKLSGMGSIKHILKVDGKNIKYV